MATVKFKMRSKAAIAARNALDREGVEPVGLVGGGLDRADLGAGVLLARLGQEPGHCAVCEKLFPRTDQDDADDIDYVNMSGASSSTTRSEKLVASLTKDEKRKFVLFLRHRPVVERTTIGSFDLQLSGHTHAGQLFTLFFSRHRIPGKMKGPIPVGRGFWLYVSRIHVPICWNVGIIFCTHSVK